MTRKDPAATVAFTIPGATTDNHPVNGFTCAVCAEPATGWTRIDGMADGKPVIDGYPTCLAHRSREAVEQLLVLSSGQAEGGQSTSAAS